MEEDRKKAEALHLKYEEATALIAQLAKEDCFYYLEELQSQIEFHLLDGDVRYRGLKRLGGDET